MYLYNTWDETGDESVECRALRKFLCQIELHKTGQVLYRIIITYVITSQALGSVFPMKYRLEIDRK